MCKLPVVIGLLLLTEAAFGKPPDFLDRIDYPGINGEAIIAGDFNGDGIVDVISLSGYEGFLLLGKGNGMFGPPNSIPFDVGSGGGVAVDINGDGKLDLVLKAGLTTGQGGIAVALGNGDGTFQPEIFYAAGDDSYVSNPVVGDFNHDGFLDVAADGESGVWVFWGTNTGVFSAAHLISIGAPTESGHYIASGDVNGDGTPDLVVGSNSAGSFVTLLGAADGNFTQFVTYATLVDLGADFTVADVNLDGRADVIVSPGTGNVVGLYLSNGDGTFQPVKTPYIPGGGLIAVGDVNGDGKPDLVSNGVYVAFGNGTGSFGAPAYYPVASGPFDPFAAYDFVLADTRNLGRLDVVALDAISGLSVLLNSGKGRYEDGLVTEVQTTTNCGVSADFNGDGKPDLALSNGSGITILFGTGKAAEPFMAGPITSILKAGCPVEGDLNNDGIPDLLVPVPGLKGVTMYSYLGKGDGTFVEAGASANSQWGFVVLADFNHDGKLDYATTTNFLALGNGDGTFQTAQPFVPGYQSPPLSFNAIAAGDLNGDGYPDLILTDGTSQSLYVLLNNKTGGWSETVDKVSSPICDYPAAMAIARTALVGYPNAVLGCASGGAVIFGNNGTGKLTYETELASTDLDEGTYVTVADVNGDGVPDIEILGTFSIAICIGTGEGKFEAPFFVGTGNYPGTQIPMDLHGQKAGLPDLVVPDSTGRLLTILNITK